MIDGKLAGVLFGLVSAVCWGTSDFGGGFTSKHNRVESVVIVTQSVGLIFLVGLIIGFHESLPPMRDLRWGVLSGLAIMLGMTGLYRSLAVGRMGIVAPIIAVVAATLPVLVSLIVEGQPDLNTQTGIALGLVAVWMVARTDTQDLFQWRELVLPVATGIMIGLFFVFIAQASQTAVFWPLLVSRATSIILLVGLTIGVMRQRHVLRLTNMPLILAVAVFDVGGTAFFVLAAQDGRLDVATVVSSLYPAITILLAWLILHEQLNRLQMIGIVLALLSIALLAS